MTSPLKARVLSRRALRYTRGAEEVAERPDFVRAASGICRIGRWLAIVQDDVHFIALVDTKSDAVVACALPLIDEDTRIFEERLGNKQHKWDLEACAAVRAPHDGADWLLAIGSGSKPTRKRVVLAKLDEALGQLTDLRVIHARALYQDLIARRDFSGSEINLEGVIWRAGSLTLFNRGNGAPSSPYLPLDATASLDWTQLWDHLHDLDHTPPPALLNARTFELGQLASVRLTFTDATYSPHHPSLTVFTASAEDSPNTYDDGVVVGSALGYILDDALIWTPILDDDGAPITDKIEGVELDPHDPTKAWIVADADDPETPGELIYLHVEGLPVDV
jgi:hypothetical protein